MKKENVYNEAVDCDEGFIQGEGYPSCEGEPCVNVTGAGTGSTDTMADAHARESAARGEDAANGDQKETNEEQEQTESQSEADGAADLLCEVARWQDKYLRLQAEFDNYRKRTLKEKMDLVETGGRDVLLEMLPVRDDVQRAVEAIEKSNDLEALRTGVMLISQKFTEALRRKGVTEIECRDKEFDADVCEAVARFDAGEEKRGRVIDVVQTGYKLGERVLRFAKVVVGE